MLRKHWADEIKRNPKICAYVQAFVPPVQHELITY